MTVYIPSWFFFAIWRFVLFEDTYVDFVTSINEKIFVYVLDCYHAQWSTYWHCYRWYLRKFLTFPLVKIIFKSTTYFTEHRVPTLHFFPQRHSTAHTINYWRIMAREMLNQLISNNCSSNYDRTITRNVLSCKWKKNMRKLSEGCPLN